MAKALLLDFGSVMSYSVFEQHAISEKRLGLPANSLTWLGPFAPKEQFGQDALGQDGLGQDELWQKMQRDEITEREYWYTRARETGELVGKADWGMLEFLRAVRDPKQLVRPEIVSLVQDAKAKGMAVGVLSNELELFYGEEVLEQIEILSHMDFMIDATHTKILKPDPKAYQLALDKLDCTPNEVVFVDDQLRNVVGGEAVGMQVVHFNITDVSKSIMEAREKLGV